MKHALLNLAIVFGCIVFHAYAFVSDRSISAPSVVKAYRATDGHSAFNRHGDRARLLATIDKLKPLHQKRGKPKRGEWLDRHEEAGQTFRQYLAVRPVTPTGRRTVIYIQPLGEFSKQEREIVELSAEYLSLYMSRPVTILEDLPLSIIPDQARRTHPQWNVKQILSTYVLQDMLKPRLPADAAAYIAFTSSDLWPGKGWNFVFGQASLRDRVGVWSIHRNGDPSLGDAEYLLCLGRTLKTATHETGHMFSIPHCTAYRCNMCGSNSLRESDTHPLYLCPECHAKICWATAADPIERYQRLIEFCVKHGLMEEQEFFMRAIAALRQ